MALLMTLGVTYLLGPSVFLSLMLDNDIQFPVVSDGPKEAFQGSGEQNTFTLVTPLLLILPSIKLRTIMCPLLQIMEARTLEFHTTEHSNPHLPHELSRANPIPASGSLATGSFRKECCSAESAWKVSRPRGVSVLQVVSPVPGRRP